MIAATARKYKISPEHAHGPEEIVQDLAKEILDFSFISAKTKLEFCKQLESLAEPKAGEKEPAKAIATGAELERVSEYRKRAIDFMSLFAALLTAMTTALLALTQINVPRSPLSFMSLSPVLLGSAVSVFSVIIASFWLMFVRRDRKERSQIDTLRIDNLSRFSGSIKSQPPSEMNP